MPLSTMARDHAARRVRPPRWGRLRAALLALPLAGLLPACQSQPVMSQVPPPVTRTTGLQAEQQLMQRIRAEIGAARCTSDDQCRTLPLGAKACGGPAQWIAWSVVDSRIERLQPLADELAQRQRRRERDEGVVSTCSVVPDPGASCVAGRCQAGDRDRAR